jgi:hypothetical protein
MEPNDEMDEIEMASDAEDAEPEVNTEVPSADIVDLVMDGKATEARDAIYATLYQKVGEKIDTLRSDLRTSSVEPTEVETESDSSEPEQE